jgi:hypothetical protein
MANLTDDLDKGVPKDELNKGAFKDELRKSVPQSQEYVPPGIVTIGPDGTEFTPLQKEE